MLKIMYLTRARVDRTCNKGDKEHKGDNAVVANEWLLLASVLLFSALSDTKGAKSFFVPKKG